MTEYIYCKWKDDNKTQCEKSSRKYKIPTDNTTKVVEEIINHRMDAEAVTAETRHSDKKSLCNERISSRYMIKQIPINPFLKDCDYVNDLNIQDTMLRPRDSNIKDTENTLHI
mgnify:CR=1 FL=1